MEDYSFISNTLHCFVVVSRNAALWRHHARKPTSNMVVVGEWGLVENEKKEGGCCFLSISLCVCGSVVLVLCGFILLAVCHVVWCRWMREA